MSVSLLSAGAEDLAKPKESAPEFRVQMHDITTNVGEPATFDCHAVGFPRPEVFWTKASREKLRRESFVAARSETSGQSKKSKGSPDSITERGVPELIPVLGSQPAGDVSHKPGGRLPLISARPAVTPAALKRAATNFAAW